MENLLKSLVDTGAEIAIIDITGVPTVDTQVAQHLLKTIAAARLTPPLLTVVRPRAPMERARGGEATIDVICRLFGARSGDC
jgi:rsbT co-antagonist protein RsbR